MVTNTRAIKVAWFRGMIDAYFKKHPKGNVSKSKLLANFALDNNSTKRTGLEILNFLEETGFIVISGDVITYGK